MNVVAIIGLCYVELPLAVEFGKKFPTIGYDISLEKVKNYTRCIDSTGHISSEDLHAAKYLTVTTYPSMLAKADFIIVAVPTPVDIAHKPYFTPLISASKTAWKYMKRNVIDIYESTVYSGATEEYVFQLWSNFLV